VWSARNRACECLKTSSTGRKKDAKSHVVEETKIVVENHVVEQLEKEPKERKTTF